MHTQSVEAALGRLAARQYGVVPARQLRELGLSQDAIERRAHAGRLRRLYRGVYSVGPLAPPAKGWELAAVLACGDGATLGWQSAGFAWRIVGRPRRVHVICGRSRPPGPGVTVHRARLDPRDRVVLDGVPVTTVARTIVDLAETLPEDGVADAVHEADVRRIFDLCELDAARARAPNRRGDRKLGRVLEKYRPRPFTRTDAERLFLALCERHNLPPPRVNTWIGEQEVDFYWPAHALVVEVDGGGAHQTRRAFEEDRRRDRRLAVKGIQVLRVVWDDLTGGGEEVSAQVRAVLAARRPC